MSGKKEYVKLWLSYGTYFQSYTPEEVGNLVLAMLAYKDTGEEPVFQGNERFIWPAIQRDINEAQDAREAAAELSRENGKKGGRPRREPAEAAEEKNLTGFSETQKTIRTKDKDMDKGHCQGQGHTGEGRHGAAASSRRPAAQKGRVYTTEEYAAGYRQEQERVNRFLLQLRRECAEQEAAEAAAAKEAAG